MKTSKNTTKASTLAGKKVKCSTRAKTLASRNKKIIAEHAHIIEHIEDAVRHLEHCNRLTKVLFLKRACQLLSQLSIDFFTLPEMTIPPWSFRKKYYLPPKGNFSKHFKSDTPIYWKFFNALDASDQVSISVVGDLSEIRSDLLDALALSRSGFIVEALALFRSNWAVHTHWHSHGFITYAYSALRVEQKL